MNSWEELWKKLLSLPPGTPQWAVALMGLMAIYLLVIVPWAAAITYLERKLVADLQARVGPNRAGPSGVLQPIADFLKLLQKQGPVETRSESQWSWLWLSIQNMALYATIAVLPIGSGLLMVDTDMSAFLPFWAALVMALGAMLLGLNQFSVPGWIGGIRVAALTLAGAFPGLIALVCAGLRAGSFRWSAFAQAQGAAPYLWTAFSSPFEFMAFGIFVVSGLVIIGIAPLDGGLAVPDIHGGVSAHIFGRRLGMFKLSRFYGFFLWALIASVLFLGGWSLPQMLTDSLRDSESWRWLEVLELIVLLLKTFAIMITVFLVAGVTPRIRADQITDLAWKVLSPFALVALAGSAIWMSWGALR